MFLLTTAAILLTAAPSKPDVVFIAVDDLNDWVQLLDPAAPIRTPNLERLARRGVVFTRAYCASPACNPSRTAVLTGLAPAATGVYGNNSDWRRALPKAVNLPRYFRDHDYRAEGAGKLFHHHHDNAFHDRDAFDDFRLNPEPPDQPMPPSKLNGLTQLGTANTDWGAWPRDESAAVDAKTVSDCVARLARTRSAPLFLACGLMRPHMPFFAPRKWFDLYPDDAVVMPTVRKGDMDDVPEAGRKLAGQTAHFFDGIMRAERDAPGTWRAAVRAYQTSATFADAQIGRLLDAVDASPRTASTIVVLWSDHGYHLGEKGHWEKFTLWEKATRVPLIVVAPGVARAGARCGRPVSLLDLYPTLVELCGLPPKPELQGQSLVPLLRDPTARCERPAVMTYLRGNHAVRSERWRYIRYADGSEELYDHDADPHEWHNLAGRDDLRERKRELGRWLPGADAQPAPDWKR